MAITIVNQPEEIILAKEPIIYEVQTDSFLTDSGHAAQAYLLFTGFPANGETFQLEFLGRIELFTFTNNALTGQLLNKIFINTGISLEDWIKRYVVPGLVKNYYLTQDYTVEYASSGGDTAKITAINRGEKYTMVCTESGANYSFTGVASGVDQTFAENFRIRCDVFGEDEYGSEKTKLIFSTDSVPDPEEYRCSFALENIIRSFGGLSIPNFTGTDTFVLEQQTKRFIVRFSEFLGFPAGAGRYFQFPEYDGYPAYHIAINGSRSYINSKAPDLLTKYVNPWPVNFLTAMQLGTTVLKNQKQYLSFFMSIAGVSVATMIKLFYDDYTESEWIIGTNAVTQRKVLTICCGYEQLAIDEIKDPTKNVVAYQVRMSELIEEEGVFSEGVNFTESFLFSVDQYAYRNARVFLFFNSFGMPETINLTGDQERSANFDSTTIRNNTNPTPENGVYKGYFEEINNTIKIGYKISSGQKTKEFLYYFLDFINSRLRFLQGEDKWIQLNIPKQKISLEDDADSIFNVSFTFDDAWIEEGIA